MFFLLKHLHCLYILIYVASDIPLLVIIVHSGKEGLREKKIPDVKKEII